MIFSYPKEADFYKSASFAILYIMQIIIFAFAFLFFNILGIYCINSVSTAYMLKNISFYNVFNKIETGIFLNPC